VSVTFNKPVDPELLFLSYPGTTGSFIVSRYSDLGFPEEGTLDFSENPTVRFTIDPSTNWEVERTYHVKIASSVKSLSGASMVEDFRSSFTIQGPDIPDGTIEDLRAANGDCAIRVKGVYMTYYRDEPNNWKGFFIQKDKEGPAIFVVTGNRKPLFKVYPDRESDGYPNIDITVTKVGDHEGFKQVLAFSMTRNTDATADLPWLKENLVQVIGDEPLTVDHESEYVQIDGVLTNNRPGGSKQNREFDLTWGTNRKVTVKISQDGIMTPLGLKNGSKVRVLAPVHGDKDGLFLKPYWFTTEEAMTAADLDRPENYDYLLDIVKLAD
jgi:hypothetical protein